MSKPKAGPGPKAKAIIARLASPMDQPIGFSSNRRPGHVKKQVKKRELGKTREPADNSPDRVAEDWPRPPASWGLGTRKPHADETPAMKKKRAWRESLHGPYEPTWGKPWAMSTQQDRALAKKQLEKKQHRPGTGKA